MMDLETKKYFHPSHVGLWPQKNIPVTRMINLVSKQNIPVDAMIAFDPKNILVKRMKSLASKTKSLRKNDELGLKKIFLSKQW